MIFYRILKVFMQSMPSVAHIMCALRLTARLAWISQYMQKELRWHS